MFRMDFTTKVLGEVAAGRLRQKAITQTLRSPNSGIVGAMLHGELKIGDYMEVALDNEVIGLAYPAMVDRVSWLPLLAADAQRGGFDTLRELHEALTRAGYRFKPLDKYLFYRVQFTWKVDEQ